MSEAALEQILTSARPKPRNFQRAFDVALSGMALVCLAPLWLGIALAVRLSDGGPVLYRGPRIGKDGQPFHVFKFRTMIVGADRRGPGITLQADDRITGPGRWLRRTKLDELPQLLNVLRGEMALVGPRPEDPRYVALYTPAQRVVLRVRPGLTGIAALEYEEETQWLVGPEWETVYRGKVMPEKLALELAYLGRRTFWTDTLLILRTFGTLLARVFRF